jgi:hypothetical protein
MSPRRRSLNYHGEKFKPFFPREESCPWGKGGYVVPGNNLNIFFPLRNNHVLEEKELKLP